MIIDLKIFYYETPPVYAAWGQWSSCSETCYPGGEKTRSRTCNQHCENVEDSDLIQTTSCNGHDCPGKKLRIVMLPKWPSEIEITFIPKDRPISIPLAFSFALWTINFWWTALLSPFRVQVQNTGVLIQFIGQFDFQGPLTLTQNRLLGQLLFIS